MQLLFESLSEQERYDFYGYFRDTLSKSKNSSKSLYEKDYLRDEQWSWAWLSLFKSSLFLSITLVFIISLCKGIDS